MKFLVFLFAVLAVLAIASANNPRFIDATQSGAGYQVLPMVNRRPAPGMIRPRYNSYQGPYFK